MKWVTEVDKSELIKEIAVELKKLDELTPPEWSIFVRTGNDKQKPPIDKDWWYMRAASIMLKVAYLGPIGVSKLRTKYGGKKRRGHKPAEFRKASGSIIRTILQQLEKAGLLRQQEKGVHKGKIVTPTGMALLNTTAKALFKKKPKPVVKPAQKQVVDAKPAADAKSAEPVKETSAKDDKKTKEDKQPEKRSVAEKPAETTEKTAADTKEEKPVAEEKPGEAKAEKPLAEEKKEEIVEEKPAVEEKPEKAKAEKPEDKAKPKDTSSDNDAKIQDSKPAKEE